MDAIARIWGGTVIVLGQLTPLVLLLIAVGSLAAARAAIAACRVVRQDLFLQHAPQLKLGITRVTKPNMKDGKCRFGMEVSLENIGDKQVLIENVAFRIDKTGFPTCKESTMETPPGTLAPGQSATFSVYAPTTLKDPEQFTNKLRGVPVKVVVSMRDVFNKPCDLEDVRRPASDLAIDVAAQSGQWRVEKHQYSGGPFSVK